MAALGKETIWWRCGHVVKPYKQSALLPVSPIVGLVNDKVRNLHVVSLPGALVIGKVSPLDQVVVHPLLIHTDKKT